MACSYVFGISVIAYNEIWVGKVICHDTTKLYIFYWDLGTALGNLFWGISLLWKVSWKGHDDVVTLLNYILLICRISLNDHKEI